MILPNLRFSLVMIQLQFHFFILPINSVFILFQFRICKDLSLCFSHFQKLLSSPQHVRKTFLDNKQVRLLTARLLSCPGKLFSGIVLFSCLNSITKDSLLLKCDRSPCCQLKRIYVYVGKPHPSSYLCHVGNLISRYL